MDLGVLGITYLLIKDYLNCRKIYIEAPKWASYFHVILRGVRQEEVLSPLHFNAPLISVVHAIESNVRTSLLADGICIWYSWRKRRRIPFRLQRSVNKIFSRLHVWGFAMSPGKCSAMFLSKRHFSKYPITVTGSIIPFVKKHRILGVVFESVMTWTPQIRRLLTRLSLCLKIMCCLAGTFWDSPSQTINLLNRSLFMTTF